jgi:hypothetical protein
MAVKRSDAARRIGDLDDHELLMIAGQWKTFENLARDTGKAGLLRASVSVRTFNHGAPFRRSQICSAVGCAKRLVRRSSKSEGGSVSTCLAMNADRWRAWRKRAFGLPTLLASLLVDLARPRRHRRFGCAFQFRRRGAVLGLDGHALEDAEIEPAQSFSIRRGGQFAIGDRSLQPRA